MLSEIFIDNLQVIILCTIVISAIFDILMKKNWIDALINKHDQPHPSIQTIKYIIGFFSALIISIMSGLLGNLLDKVGIIIFISCVLFSLLLIAISIDKNIAPTIIIILAVSGLYLMYVTSQPPVVVGFTSDPLDMQILGKSIRFTARAEDINDDQIFYQFLLDGSVIRGWSKSNSWTWDTRQISESAQNPKGKYNVTICIKDGKYDNIIDDSRSLNYTLTFANITYPHEGDDVKIGQIPVNGTSLGILPNEKDKLWIFVKNSRTDYHPQNNNDLHIKEDGNWSTIIDLGGEIGKMTEIVAVIVNESALKDIHSYYIEGSSTNAWPGLRNLSAGAEEADYITITKR